MFSSLYSSRTFAAGRSRMRPYRPCGHLRARMPAHRRGTPVRAAPIAEKNQGKQVVAPPFEEVEKLVPILSPLHHYFLFRAFREEVVPDRGRGWKVQELLSGLLGCSCILGRQALVYRAALASSDFVGNACTRSG